MINKITHTKYNSRFQNIFFGIVLLFSASLFAVPVITSVSPTRVTNGSTVTITGSGFTNTTATTIMINGSSSSSVFTVKSKSTTQIILEISAITDVFGTGVTTVTVSGVAVNSISPYLLTFVTPVSKGVSSNVRISKIYTDYNGFWASSATSSIKTNQPNTSHNLLGFEYKKTIGANTYIYNYSTGVNDAKLTANGVSFIPQYYRAFSTRGVLGKTHSNLFLAMADLIDGTAHDNLGNPNSPDIAGLTCYDVLVDGFNGLDLGTGVTNFNQDATVDFTSDNVQTGPSNSFFTDAIPDIILTQVADPGTSTDYYYFTDNIGNVVGTPVSIKMSDFTAIGTYRLDLFTFPNGQPIGTTVINGNRTVDSRTRDLRLLGLSFSDFGINNLNYSNVKALSMAAGGSADLAFMAYNTNSFFIQAPHVVSAPNPINICKLPYSGNITFSVSADVDGAGDASTLTYRWKKNNTTILKEGIGDTFKSYTITGPITATDFATYKVEIFNQYGAIVAASAILKLGGDAVEWDGTSWSSTPNNISSLIFSSDYDSTTKLIGTELQGCDCTINSGVTVTVDSGDSMILQNFLNVKPATVATDVPLIDENTGLPVLDGMGNPIIIHTPAKDAGKLNIKDKGSLVQINETAVNEGEISYNRKATNLKAYDYVYWSSPVSNFNIAGIASTSNPKIFSWDSNLANTGNSTYGNWVNASGVMEAGKGYISRVSNASDFTVNFSGVPNNGIYNKTITGTANPDPEDDYWNLIGNPYPSPINAEKFLLANTTDIKGYLQIWTHGTAIGSYSNPYYQNYTYNYNPADYIVVNGMTSVPAGFNGYIAAGQGFFVKGKTNSGTVTFNNLLRYETGKTAYNNGQFYRTSSEDVEKSIIWLSLLNPLDKESANIAVGYIKGATLEKDDLYDAPRNEEKPIELFSLIKDDEKFVIQGRPAPFEDSDAIPLGFKVATNGNYTIVIDKTSGVFEGDQSIFIEDKELNVVHDLKASPYNFVSNAGTFNERFNLIYKNEIKLGINDFKTATAVAFIANNTLNINTVDEMQSFSVYDISGKLILNDSFKEINNKVYSNDFHYGQGIYLVKIKFTNGQTVTKKLVK